MTKEKPYTLRESDQRPWGDWLVIDTAETFAVKKIKVKPHQRLSLQYHHFRSEHWIVVEGQGSVVRNKEKIAVVRGDHIYIPMGAHHRIENTGDDTLIFIEIQIGEKLAESDIVRLEDDYRRVDG